MSVSTSTCELDTLRESPSRPNFTCRMTVLSDRLCSCLAIGMANAAINTLLLLFSDELLDLWIAGQFAVTAETSSSYHQT